MNSVFASAVFFFTDVLAELTLAKVALKMLLEEILILKVKSK